MISSGKKNYVYEDEERLEGFESNDEQFDDKNVGEYNDYPQDNENDVTSSEGGEQELKGDNLPLLLS